MTDAEARLLAGVVGQVRSLLAGRANAAPDDPLAELTGMALGPSTAPDDPALARLLPDFHRDDANLASGLRVLHERDVIDAKDDAAAALLDSLPAGGGTIRLDVATARAWLTALNDVRLVFGVRLGITDDDGLPEAATAVPGSARRGAYDAYAWVSAVQESLVQALLRDV